MMLRSALCGNYVNFGVLRLYGDQALDKALNMFIKLLVSIPLKNLLVSCHVHVVSSQDYGSSIHQLVLWLVA